MDSSDPAPHQLPIPRKLPPDVFVPISFLRKARIRKTTLPDVSIIIPARNEEANIAACLGSLGCQTGVTFEILVVDDGSTDRTREIARGFDRVQVISPEPLPEHWTGKNNAIVAGVKKALAPWILFTDADTIHLPGSLARALSEAMRKHADLLSYSPRQVVVSFCERATMPIIFAELAAQYPPHKVRDPNSGIVAANGQYILVRRAAYDAAGGHAAIATEILEDVALARRFRSAGYCVHFRYGADAVRTRMYRNWAQLREGWTKNLALLFPHSEWLACKTVLWWLAAWSMLVATINVEELHVIWPLSAAIWFLSYRRIRSAHFSVVNTLIAITCGLPIVAYLLLRSERASRIGQVSWKGRSYDTAASEGKRKGTLRTAEPALRIHNQGFKTSGSKP